MAWVPVGKVCAKVYVPAGLAATTFFSEAPSTAPFSFICVDSEMPWPLLLIVISTAMSFFGPPMPRCTPYTRP